MKFTNPNYNPLNDPKNIEQHFRETYEREFKQPDQNASFDQNLLFISVTYKPELISIREAGDVKAHPIAEFKKLNYAVVRRILGNNIERKLNLQPMIYCYVDFEGSRSGHGSTELRKPHIHALALVRPEHKLQYQVRMQNALLDSPNSVIEDVRIEPYDRNKSTVVDLITYCMKGLKGMRTERREWLQAVLPAR